MIYAHIGTALICLSFAAFLAYDHITTTRRLKRLGISQ